MNKLIVFSKHFKDFSPRQMIDAAVELGLDGYDLAVRPGYPVNPDNAAAELPKLVAGFRAAGVDVPMVTGNFDLLWPDHPTAEPILAAMAAADVRLIKLGYYKFDPHTMDYWAEVDKIRRGLEGWSELSRTHGVKICYHTHSDRCMGLNAGMLAHLIRGMDPACIGAYLDAGHLMREGEEFAVALAVAAEHLSIVAVKDMLPRLAPKNGHYALQASVVPAGCGGVDWSAVFDELLRVDFAGPLSVHCEFDARGDEFLPTVRREVAFFRRMIAEARERAAP